MRINSQRGVSLMLLIIAITVFAGVALGIVTLLRVRHQSYPYQVQSYQAYTLANAGAEFAIQYIKDNVANITDANSFANYIPMYPTYKDFSFGSGKFSLSYAPGDGCNDILYSKGTYGTATREVKIFNFGNLFAQLGSTVYIPITAVPKRTCYGPGCASDPYQAQYPANYYVGDRIQLSYCNPNPPGTLVVLSTNGTSPIGTIAARSIDFPAQQVTLGRLGFRDQTSPPTDSPLQVWWVWDGTCGITGPAVQGINPYCPGAYVQGLDHCPTTTSPPYAGLGLVDCVTGGANPQFLFPLLSWNNYPNTPPTPGYPFFFNTDTNNSTNTAWDPTCRPLKPCDPSGPENGRDGSTCVARNQCVNPITDKFCPSQTWPPLHPVATTGQYSCFDNDRTCSMAYGSPTEKSRAYCHYPVGSWPGGVPMPVQDVTLYANLNRLTIETIGHLDAMVGTNGVKFYVSFNTSKGATVLKFTVH